ncbi:MAG: trypsin-like peptidase domain-containing protein [Gemmatimonadales bacterium]
MKLQLTVLDGPRKGMTAVFSADVSVGRHPGSAFQFDPDQDLEVSSRHAVLVRDGDKWSVRDLGSSNGTLVNGHAITMDVRLGNTDQVRFGKDGPKVEIRLVPDSTPDHAPHFPVTRSSASQAKPSTGAQPAAGELVDTGSRRPSGGTTQRIRVEVGRQTRRVKTVAGVLVGVLAVVAGGLWVNSARQRSARAAETAAMQARIDSILAESEQAITQLQGQMQGLATALEQSQGDVQRLTQDLTRARRSGNSEEVALLTQQLQDASDALRYQQAAAQVDFRAINDANHRAVAMIWADFGNGNVGVGTAFGVRTDGRMITNRHVVAGAQGNRTAQRIAVQFTNSDQVFPARVVLVDRNHDLAIVRVQGIAGGIPTVQGMADGADLTPGDPVAMIGFPLGSELPMHSSGERPVVRTSLTAGIVSKVLPDLVQLDGYGAEGASGSPIFNQQGRVVAVLYGGQPGTSGRVIFSVPGRYVDELIRQTN